MVILEFLRYYRPALHVGIKGRMSQRRSIHENSPTEEKKLEWVYRNSQVEFKPYDKRGEF